jgi:hypothetical protein
MPIRSAVTTETRKRKKETRDAFTVEINDAVDSFHASLYNIAEKYNQFVSSFSTPSWQTMTS